MSWCADLAMLDSLCYGGLGRAIRDLRRWRLRFLYDLARAGDAVTQFGPLLAGTLGEPTARAWQRAHDTIEQFTQLHGPPGNRDTLLDLRREKRT